MSSRIAVVFVFALMLWCGYGHEFFDYHENPYAIWPELGATKFMYNGDPVKLYWIINDVNFAALLFTYFSLGFVLLAFRVNRYVIAGFALLFATNAVYSLLDVLQVTIFLNSHKFWLIEIILQVLSVATLLVALKTKLIPKVLRNRIEAYEPYAIGLFTRNTKRETDAIKTAADTIDELQHAEMNTHLAKADLLLAEMKQREFNTREEILEVIAQYSEQIDNMISLYKTSRDPIFLDESEKFSSEIKHFANKTLK